MRITITGAAGSIGRGIAPRLLAAGHELVLSDIREPELPGDPAATFVRADVRTGEGLAEALAGSDLLLHLPAWHGIHLGEHSETEFWQLNVDGTFNALLAAREAGVGRAVWLSSQSWHEQRTRYGFTKVVGELLLDYSREQSGLSYVAVRPGDFTPWSDYASYGRGLLYGRVHRDDVLDAVQLSIEWVADHDGALIVDATRPDAVDEAVLAAWDADPVAAAERAFPGARAAIERFGLDVTAAPPRPNRGGWDEIGYRPSRTFGEWVREAATLDDAEVASRRSDW